MDFDWPTVVFPLVFMIPSRSTEGIRVNLVVMVVVQYIGQVLIEISTSTQLTATTTTDASSVKLLDKLG